LALALRKVLGETHFGGKEKKRRERGVGEKEEVFFLPPVVKCPEVKCTPVGRVTSPFCGP